MFASCLLFTSCPVHFLLDLQQSHFLIAYFSYQNCNTFMKSSKQYSCCVECLHPPTVKPLLLWAYSMHPMESEFCCSGSIMQTLAEWGVRATNGVYKLHLVCLPWSTEHNSLAAHVPLCWYYTQLANISKEHWRPAPCKSKQLFPPPPPLPVWHQLSFTLTCSQMLDSGPKVWIPPVSSQVKCVLYPSYPRETSLWLKGLGINNVLFLQ